MLGILASMSKVVAINRADPFEPRVLYVYGRTLREIEREMGGNPEHLFDIDGTPVLDSEFYEITSCGIQRVA